MRDKVRILYKSGNSIVIKCDNFKTVKTGGELREVSWDNPKPRPLFIGVNDIEAVWKL